MLYGARLAIAGIGLSAVAGTLMALWTPVEGEVLSEAESQERVTAATPGSLRQSLGRELTGLDSQLQELLGQYPELTPGIMVVDVATGDYVRIGEGSVFAAASTIKVPILVAFFQAVDAGQVQLEEPLRLEESHIQGGSGSLQYEAPGLELSALEVATLMIVESDNTATNLLIDRLGGFAALNDRFRQWGMRETVLEDWLPDVQGTNQTTPEELAGLLGQIERGELLSMGSRDRLLRIMMMTENDTLLPQGLGTGAVIAHKTGNLRGVLADAGLVDVPNGQRYVVVALVERPEYDDRAVELIRELSARVYGYFAGSNFRVGE
jgi:beta-lactamase class A